MFKLDIEKAEEPEIKLPTSFGSSKKQESSRKTSTSASALSALPKPLTVWITRNWKTLHEMRIPDHLTCLLRHLYEGQEAILRTGHGATDWFQIGKGLCEGCNCHHAYLTYMQRTSCEMPGWRKHKLESRLPGEISTTSGLQMIPL